MTVHLLDRQADELDRQLTMLIKRYQFRDRNVICCEDVTVSQCYVLKTLREHGPLVMTRLAELMCLGLSGLNRVVEQLVRKGYVTRRRLPADRRVRCVELTPVGKETLHRMEIMIRRSEREVLGRLSESDRRGLLNGLRRLNAALEERTSACGPPQLAGAK